MKWLYNKIQLSSQYLNGRINYYFLYFYNVKRIVMAPVWLLLLFLLVFSLYPSFVSINSLFFFLSCLIFYMPHLFLYSLITLCPFPPHSLYYLFNGLRYTIFYTLCPLLSLKPFFYFSTRAVLSSTIVSISLSCSRGYFGIPSENEYRFRRRPSLGAHLG